MTEPRRVHLPYLEGIRGWAAVFVALHHVWQFVILRPDLGPLPGWFRALTVFKFGGYAVPVFIVLSGYCLMLPVACSGTPVLPGGIRQFALRRARRILIPYYAALGLALLLILIHPSLSEPRHTQWDFALPALSSSSVLSHLVLVHNWFEHLQWTIDPPMWTIAIEWQIYFVFALVLLPLWRRFGPLATVVIAFTAGLVPISFGYGFASPWFVGLFALGMVAAAAGFAPRFPRRVNDPRIWERACLGLFVLVAVLSALKLDILAHPSAIMDTLVGLAAVSLLLASARRHELGQVTAIGRVLSHPISVKLGEFSYSIYLIHFPLLAVAYFGLLDLHVSPLAIFSALTGVALPLILLTAYAFHRVFERPFMQRARPLKREHGAAPIVAAPESARS
jgi:peptidoglycan/LPS O-acetylase OafA/YrhL